MIIVRVFSCLAISAGLYFIWILTGHFIFKMVTRGMLIYKSAILIQYLLLLIVILLFLLLVRSHHIDNMIRENSIPVILFYLFVLYFAVILLGVLSWNIQKYVHQYIYNPAIYNMEQYRNSYYKQVLDLLAPVTFLLVSCFRHIRLNPFHQKPFHWLLNQLHPLLWPVAGMFWSLIALLAGSFFHSCQYLPSITSSLVFFGGGIGILQIIKKQKECKYILFCVPLSIVFFSPVYKPLVNQTAFFPLLLILVLLVSVTFIGGTKCKTIRF